VNDYQVEIGKEPAVTIRYDTIGEFNLDSKAEYSLLNLAHVTE